MLSLKNIRQQNENCMLKAMFMRQSSGFAMEN